ncbi:MAG: DUF1552 domain-containing protein [Gemmataceae bacterium]
MSSRLDRRTALKGMGVSLALPLLDAMLPGSALAGTGGKAPLRMAFLYVPNGVMMPDWKPKDEGANFELPATLKPLQPFRDQLLVLTGLTADKARPNGDGPGDHARAMSAFLTGCQPRKTAGANIKVGVSVDQLAAQKIGSATRFASLEIGCESGRQAGNCDSGYSCAYSSTISWRGEASPVAKETNPRLVFNRLFAVESKPGDAQTLRQAGYRRSLLDYVAEDARSLKNRLGNNDQRKLEEYLTGVREIEQRLARVEKDSDVKGLPAGASAPSGLPRDMQHHLRLLADMMVLAFQADLTRICTFAFANEGSNRPYREIGISDGHHDLSHHGRKQEKTSKLQKINLFHIEQVAYLLDRLRQVREGSGTLLDSCMIAYGSGNSDGDRHNHDDLPILLMGGGGGSLKSGRHIVYPRNTPLNNLWIEMLDRVNVKVEQFGDSNGRLPGLRG